MASSPPLFDFEPKSPSPSELDAFNELSQCYGDTSNVGKDSTDPDLPTPLTANIVRPGLGRFGSKRIRDDFPTNSSDTPLFSSDDVSATIENYNEHRRKRQHKGHWWDGRSNCFSQIPIAKPERKKREFQRTVDSAVWMGSDETNPEEFDIEAAIYESVRESSKESRPEEDSLRDLKSWKSPDHALWQEHPRDLDALQNAQRGACMVIQRCAEDGIETVDLTGRELGEVLGSTLRPLRYLTLQTPPYLPPSQEAYQSLTPSVRLFLGHNNLKHLPGELYKLQNLTELSLRQNHLKEILPAISKLKKLEVLNLSSNDLHWLPWELLQLSRHRLWTLRLHPNPLMEPVSSIHRAAISEEQRVLWRSSLTQAVAATKVAYLDISGAACRGSPPAPSSVIEYSPTRADSETKRFTGPWCEQGLNHVPSLFEVALRGCSKSLMFEQLPYCLPADSPPRPLQLLKYARDVKEAGGNECSLCGQNYIIPRTEWMEWWISPWDIFGRPLPFLRRGCSWKCTPNLDDVDEAWRDCGWISPTERTVERA